MARCAVALLLVLVVSGAGCEEGAPATGPRLCLYITAQGDTAYVDVVAENGDGRTVRAIGVDVQYDGYRYVDTLDWFGTFAEWRGSGAFGGNSNGTIARAGGFTTGNGFVLGVDDLQLYRILFVKADGTPPGGRFSIVGLWDHVKDMDACSPIPVLQ